MKNLDVKKSYYPSALQSKSQNTNKLMPSTLSNDNNDDSGMHSPSAWISNIEFTPFMTQVPLINFVVIAIPAVILSFSFGYVICKTPILKRIF